MTPRQAEALAAARLQAVAVALKKYRKRDERIAAKVAEQKKRPKSERLTLEQIGKPYKLSRQRVFQIVSRMAQEEQEA